MAIWQYSESGRVPGVKGGTGAVDLNISYKDYPAIIRAGGYNNYPKPVAPPEITGLTLDTPSGKDLATGERYTVLAKCKDKPTVTTTGRDVIAVSEPRLDPKGRGWLIDVEGLPPEPVVRHGHIAVTAAGVTQQCNFNVL